MLLVEGVAAGAAAERQILYAYFPKIFVIQFESNMIYDLS